MEHKTNRQTNKMMAIFGSPVMLLGLMLNIGCAKEKAADAPTAAAVVVDCARTACAPGTPGAPTGATGAENYSGSTVALTNVTGLSQMFYNSYPNNPTNIQINIDLSRTVDSVIISFVDGGKVVEAGLGTQFPDGTNTNSSYNGWVTEGSSRNYKGFFQDKYGAVVVVIDKVLNTGDGTASALVGGSVYFQNFGDNPAADSKCQSGQPAHYNGWTYVPDTCMASQLMCWQITYGPYDCRTFLSGSSVAMTSTAYPTNRGPTRTKSYVKLADFAGMSRAAANLPTP